MQDKIISITQFDMNKHGCPKCNSHNAHDFITQGQTKLCVCYDCESTFGVVSGWASMSPLPNMDGKVVGIVPVSHPLPLEIANGS